MMWYSLLIKWQSESDCFHHWITNDIVKIYSTFNINPNFIKITIIKKDNISDYTLGDDSEGNYLEYYKVL